MKSPVLLAMALVSAILLTAGCNGRSATPEGLIGVWKTGAEGSTDVSIEFSGDRLIISSDTGVFENSIEKVKDEKGSLPGSLLYTVYYRDRDGETNLMSFFYTPEDGGVIRFRSEQDTIWKKDSSE